MNDLDLKTKLYLYLTHTKVVNHEDVNKNIKLDIPSFRYGKNEVFIFKNYEEYKNYFLMFVDNINDDIINTAIYTKGKDGQIVVFASLCNYIIVRIIRSNSMMFYDSITDEQIEEIHLHGKLTPLEKVEEWEESDLCVPGDAVGSVANRCHAFENCHECLMEYASHKLEHERMDFRLVNSFVDEKAKKLTM